jgi:calcineurin-like phosphoesterase family protein
MNTASNSTAPAASSAAPAIDIAKTFLTADWHLGEDRFKIMARPFTTAQEMIDFLVARHNAIVSPEDTVLVVGDVCYQKAPQFLPEVARFNGRKILFRGNHDRVFTDEQLAPYFAEIVPEGDGREYDINGLKCWVTHYPTTGRPDLFNLVGHIHAAWKFQVNMLNVGVDVNHFRPYAMSDVPGAFEAICKFYDKDVWVAYEDVNARHKDARGAKTAYFKKD